MNNHAVIAAVREDAVSGPDYHGRACAAGREVLASLGAVVPLIRVRRDETERANRVPDASVAELERTGIFRAFTPLQWGGLEMDPASFYESLMTIAGADSSTAWIVGQLGVHSWQIALMDERMQRDFWADGPDARASSAYAPVGKVRAVDGGFVLTGTWVFSSGVDHASWTILGGFIRDESGAVIENRCFVVPRSDFTIQEDSWDVAGLKGTGSKSITLDEVFVPDYRTHRGSDLINGTSPGLSVNDRPLYHLTWMTLFYSTPASTSIGTTLGAIDEFIADAVKRTSKRGTGSAVTADPFLQLKLANTLSRAQNVRDRQLADWRGFFAKVCRGERLTPIEGIRSRFNAADATSTCFEAFAELFTAAGAGAVMSNSPMQFHFRNLIAARNHGTAARETAAAIYAQTLLGVEPPPSTGMINDLAFHA